MLGAPIVDALIEVFAVEAAEGGIIPFAEGVAPFVVQEKIAKPVAHVQPLGLEGLCHQRRIGGCIAIILRLVREEANQLAPKALGKALVILFVGFFDKRRHHGGIENIGVGMIHAHVHVQIRALLRNAHVALGALHEGGKGLGIKIAARKLQILGKKGLVFQKLAANEAARPAVFIVAPGVHPQLARLL